MSKNIHRHVDRPKDFTKSKDFTKDFLWCWHEHGPASDSFKLLTLNHGIQFSFIERFIKYQLFTLKIYSQFIFLHFKFVLTFPET